jgi:4-hydroxy-tetrahydrodipicolinate synthase
MNATDSAGAVWAMVPTPFTRGGERICDRSLRALTREMLRRGCTGSIALGVIAEPASLSLAEKMTVLDAVLGASAGAPVIATVMSLDRKVAEDEVSALVARFGTSLAGVMIPVRSTDPDVVRRSVIDTHRLSHLPVVVQDLPSATGVRIDIDDLVGALAGLGSSLMAVKAEAPPTFSRIRRLREDLGILVMSGNGGIGMVDDFLAGAQWAAAGVSRPEALVQAERRLESGDVVGAQRMIDSVASLISYETQPGTSIAIRKEHWRRQGVIADSAVRPPTMSYDSAFDVHSERMGFAAG